MSDNIPMTDDREANAVCGDFYTRGTIERPNIRISGFLITADESDQYISYLFNDGRS